MKPNLHDAISVGLIALIGAFPLIVVTALPMIAAAPATYGLTPVTAAWLGLVGAVIAAVLNRQPRIGDGQ